jgi:hypothetical protein
VSLSSNFTNFTVCLQTDRRIFMLNKGHLWKRYLTFFQGPFHSSTYVWNDVLRTATNLTTWMKISLKLLLRGNNSKFWFNQCSHPRGIIDLIDMRKRNPAHTLLQKSHFHFPSQLINFIRLYNEVIPSSMPRVVTCRVVFALLIFPASGKIHGAYHWQQWCCRSLACSLVSKIATSRLAI